MPAVLFTLSGALLARAREIDLSLDQQCFFAAVLQVTLMKVMPPAAAILVTVVVLTSLQSLRLWFNRRTDTETLVSSIAAGMVYLGLAFGLIFILGGPTPEYPHVAPLWLMATMCVGLIAVLILADRFSAEMGRVTFSVSPELGGSPGLPASVALAVLPAAILTAAAAVLLGTYAGHVTQSFTGGLGVLGATVAMITFARVPRSIAAGAALAAIFIVPQFISPTAGGIFQSYLVPSLSLLLVAGVALVVNKP